MRTIKAVNNTTISDLRFESLMLEVEHLAVAKLKANPRNARKHPSSQIEKLADAIRRFGFIVPILIDRNDVLIAGHARLQAAQRAGLKTVPALRLDHLTEAEQRAFAIFDNKIPEFGEWDLGALAIEFQALLDIDFDMDLTGFSMPEIDFTLETAAAPPDPADDLVPSPDGPAVSVAGDLWLLGEHRLFCGSSLEAASYAALLGDERADVVFADPPYNVAIRGHVSGLGKHQHREFAMASGEMDQASFTGFLRKAFEQLVAHSHDGSIHFHCMDWRHMGEVIEAANGVYTELKNLCVWAKDNGGMGSLYRSRHELVFVYKFGTAPHVNAVELGRFGRNRTNVWEYPGQNTFHSKRDSELALHPTVKPVALVADAIRDVSHRNAIVLDPFAGSGTTLLAAERSGRRARCIELDPLYVDVAIRRWEQLTGAKARHAATGQEFASVAATRMTKEIENVPEI